MTFERTVENKRAYFQAYAPCVSAAFHSKHPDGWTSSVRRSASAGENDDESLIWPTKTAEVKRKRVCWQIHETKNPPLDEGLHLILLGGDKGSRTPDLLNAIAASGTHEIRAKSLSDSFQAYFGFRGRLKKVIFD